MAEGWDGARRGRPVEPRPDGRGSAYGGFDRVEQYLALERLEQVGRGSRSLGARACRGIIMGGDEDDRDGDLVRGQSLLQIEPVHPATQVNVQDQAGGQAERGRA